MDMWTEILASYAAVVSTSSLAISYLAYKSGAPKLSGNAELRQDMDGPILRIAVHNRGRGAITVESVELLGIYYDGFQMVPGDSWKLSSPEHVLPARIEGHSGIRWNFPAHNITKDWLESYLNELDVKIHLATGKTLTIFVKTDHIDRLGKRRLL